MQLIADFSYTNMIPLVGNGSYWEIACVYSCNWHTELILSKLSINLRYLLFPYDKMAQVVESHPHRR